MTKADPRNQQVEILRDRLSRLSEASLRIKVVYQFEFFRGFLDWKFQTDTLRFFPLFSHTDAIADPGLREDVAGVVGVVA